MELWIRSQNKENLLMVNKMFCHCTCPEMESIGEYYIGNKEWVGDKDYILLGKYKTKERALEILDEIQSKIGNIYLCKIKSMVKTGDARMVKEYLEENYIGDFIMTDATMDIEPINKDVVMYEMPEK